MMKTDLLPARHDQSRISIESAIIASRPDAGPSTRRYMSGRRPPCSTRVPRRVTAVPERRPTKMRLSPLVTMSWSEIGWEKRTPKSDKIERRRCQYERCPSRKIHEGIPPGSSEAGNGREAIIAGGSPPVVPGAIDVRVLGEGTKGRQTGRCRQDVQALD